MGIVAAGMAGARIVGNADSGPLEVFGMLGHGQRIHIGTEDDMGAFPAGVQSGDKGTVGDHLVGQAQTVADGDAVVAGLVFLAAQLGEAMDGAAMFDDQISDLIGNIHHHIDFPFSAESVLFADYSIEDLSEDGKKNPCRKRQGSIHYAFCASIFSLSSVRYIQRSILASSCCSSSAQAACSSCSCT